MNAQTVGASLSQGGSFLIVGLGNPGRLYEKTRHNIGFMALDRLAERLGEKGWRYEMKAMTLKAVYVGRPGGDSPETAEVEPAGRRLILAKPQTYMNASGQAVGSLRRFYKVGLEHVLVVYDDVDLPLGTLRLRPGGGSGGHKGMKSIIESLGSEAFPRLRMGIGRPPGRMEAADYVLGRFSRGEEATVEEMLSRAVEATLTFIGEGLEKAMNRYNG